MKITQDELAGQLNIPRGTYAHYEIGKREPDNSMLLKIAEFFNVSTDYLLGRTEDKNYNMNYELAQQIETVVENMLVSDDIKETLKTLIQKNNYQPSKGSSVIRTK